MPKVHICKTKITKNIKSMKKKVKSQIDKKKGKIIGSLRKITQKTTTPPPQIKCDSLSFIIQGDQSSPVHHSFESRGYHERDRKRTEEDKRKSVSNIGHPQRFGCRITIIFFTVQYSTVQHCAVLCSVLDASSLLCTLVCA